MPYEIAIPAIDTAIRNILTGDATLAALVRTKPVARGGGMAIYDDGDVAQGQTPPYLTIGAWTQVPFHNFSPDDSSDLSGWGWNCTGQIKAIGQTQGTLYTVMSRVFELFHHGRTLNVSGYTSSWADEFNLQPMLKETLAGATWYHLPAILRVYACDT